MLNKILANFETSLANKISTTSLTLTLATSTDDDGNPLSGDYILTLDEGTNKMEHLRVTLTGASGASAVRGLSKVDMTTSKTANKFAHDIGASVKITNAVLIDIVEELNGSIQNNELTGTNQDTWKIGDGTDTDKILEAYNGDANEPWLKYDSATNKWLLSNDGVNSYDPEAGGSGVTAGDGISIIGGAVSTKINGTDLVENLGGGTDELGLNADLSGAVTGTSGTPSATNKFVTNDDASATSSAGKIVRGDGSGKIDEGFQQTTNVNVTTLTNGSDAASLHTHTNVNRKLVIDHAQHSFNTTFSEQTLFTQSVLANTLGTSNGIHVRIYVSALGALSGSITTFRFKYGGTTLVSINDTASTAINNTKGFIDFYLLASGATNSQKGVARVDLGQDIALNSDTNDVFRVGGVGTATEDSTGALTLSVTWQSNNDSSSNRIITESGVATILK